MAEYARTQYTDECGVRLSRIVRGNHDKKLVALTFDDGPHAGYTVKLLQVLKALHVKATFFLVGKQVDKFPQLVQREVLLLWKSTVDERVHVAVAQHHRVGLAGDVGSELRHHEIAGALVHEGLGGTLPVRG